MPVNKNNKVQRGGNNFTGYSFDLAQEKIGGQMEVKGYSDCDTPAYFNKYAIYDVKTGGGKKTMKKSMMVKKSKMSKKSMMVKKSKMSKKSMMVKKSKMSKKSKKSKTSKK
jgi:hypothetical protein